MLLIASLAGSSQLAAAVFGLWCVSALLSRPCRPERAPLAD